MHATMAEDRAHAYPVIRKPFVRDVRSCLKLLTDPIQILLFDRPTLEFDWNCPMTLLAPGLGKQ